jgi:uncharacterized protein (DUF2249 family)
MTLTTYGTKIDLRPLAPRERHPLVFNTFRALADGEALELVNDHDPRPLYAQFRAELAGRFSWEDLIHGPDTWRVRITKLAAQGEGRCCGACGGA